MQPCQVEIKMHKFYNKTNLTTTRLKNNGLKSGGRGGRGQNLKKDQFTCGKTS